MTKKPTDAPVTIADPERARAEVSRLNGQELGIAMLYRQKFVDLAGVRAERGDRVLASDDPAGAARDSGHRVSALLEELEALADASKRARERRVAAIPAVFEAEARTKERQADQLEAEATKLEAESARLREALERADDWGYFPAEGRVDGRYLPAVAHGAGEFRVIDARGPVFQRRRDDAQSLRQQAAQHRLRKPDQAGMLEADTVEELLAAVHSAALRVGPPVDSITAWSEQVIEKERRRRARVVSTEDAFVKVGTPYRLHLEWQGGVIDQAQSHVVRPEPPEVSTHFHDTVAAGGKFSRRPESSRSPFDTSATPAELEREAAATGKSIEQVAKELGVPVPEGLAQVAESN